MTATLDFPEPSSFRDAPAGEAYGPADAIATAYDVHRNASRGILCAVGFALLRVLRPEDHKDFQRLRAEALVRHLHAYCSIPGEAAAPDDIAARARLAATQDQFVVGAFCLRAMVGMLGLLRLRPQKLCHHTNLWGAYVAHDLRGQGLAKSLLRLVPAEALRRPGIEQVAASVCSDSAAARQLFHGAGFKRWGVTRQAAKVESAYLDEEHDEPRLIRKLRDNVASFESAPTGETWRGD